MRPRIRVFFAIQELTLVSLLPSWNLIDDDYAQGSVVLIVVPLENSAPVVHPVSYGFRIIQANELNAALPAQTFFHQLAHPPDDGGFTAARGTVYYVQQRLSQTLVDLAEVMLQVF